MNFVTTRFDKDLWVQYSGKVWRVVSSAPVLPLFSERARPGAGPDVLTVFQPLGYGLVQSKYPRSL